MDMTIPLGRQEIAGTVNIFFYKYGSSEPNESSIPEKTYDYVWTRDNPNDYTTKGKIRLGNYENIAHNQIINYSILSYFLKGDLNKDRKVNLEDFSIFANEWGGNNTLNPNRFGSYVGSDPNDLGAYADINRDGVVDLVDLQALSDYWLWDSNDPESWL